MDSYPFRPPRLPRLPKSCIPGCWRMHWDLSTAVQQATLRRSDTHTLARSSAAPIAILQEDPAAHRDPSTFTPPPSVTWFGAILSTSHCQRCATLCPCTTLLHTLASAHATNTHHTPSTTAGHAPRTVRSRYPLDLAEQRETSDATENCVSPHAARTCECVSRTLRMGRWDGVGRAHCVTTAA